MGLNIFPSGQVTTMALHSEFTKNKVKYLCFKVQIFWEGQKNLAHLPQKDSKSRKKKICCLRFSKKRTLGHFHDITAGTLSFSNVISIPATIIPMADSMYYLICFTKITQNPVFMVPQRKRYAKIASINPIRVRTS